MKLFYLFSIFGSSFSQEIYEECADVAQCNYSCDNRENCFGTGRTGILPNRADTACCAAGDQDSICADANLCATLPGNYTLLNEGYVCKYSTLISGR